MTVYGFSDKETAQKLRQMAQGSENGSGGLKPPYRGKGYRVSNQSGGEIPAYGIAFTKEINTTTDGNRNSTFTVEKFSSLDSDDIKDMFLVNGPTAIPNNKKGTLVADQRYYKILVDSNPEKGKKYGVLADSYTLTEESNAEDSSPLFLPVGSRSTKGIAVFQLLVEGGGGTAFFYTGDLGIPAAISKTQPTSEEIEKRFFDTDTKEIKPFDPPEFYDVYNHTLGDVGPEKFIQAKKIDGVWFVDVEPCAGGD